MLGACLFIKPFLISEYHKGATYVRLAIDPTIILRQILSYFVNWTMGHSDLWSTRQADRQAHHARACSQHEVQCLFTASKSRV